MKDGDVIKFLRAGGDTHQKKRSANNLSRGEIPITKNVEVTDQNGNIYAPTYTRRAKGLVKAGRARWSDEAETVIRLLARPAHNIEEAYEMDIYDNDGNMTGAPRAHDTAARGSGVTDEVVKNETVKDEAEFSIGYMLAQMEKIRADNKNIINAIHMVDNIVTHAPSLNACDYASQAKAEAIGSIITTREATNMKLLSMYEKMYEDTKSSRTQYKMDSRAGRFEMLYGVLQDMKGNPAFGHEFAKVFNDAFKNVFE